MIPNPYVWYKGDDARGPGQPRHHHLQTPLKIHRRFTMVRGRKISRHCLPRQVGGTVYI